MCRSNTRKVTKKVHVHDLNITEDSSSDEFFIGSLIKVNMISMETMSTSSSWFEPVRVGNNHIKIKIDSGAEKKAIPLKTWKKMKNCPKLNQSNIQL